MPIADVQSQNLTVGQIAERLGVPHCRIIYAINSRKIQPIMRAARYRLYGPAEVSMIRQAITEITNRGEAVAHV